MKYLHDIKMILYEQINCEVKHSKHIYCHDSGNKCLMLS